MKYSEKIMDLFTVSEEFVLVHCISCDAAMGKGIAEKFVGRYPELKKLRINWEVNNQVGSCKRIDNVFNLITKERYWHKPTYRTLKMSLLELKEICLEQKVEKIAMPQIGSGLDRLNWNEVRKIIQEVFQDTEIEILVCIFK